MPYTVEYGLRKYIEVLRSNFSGTIADMLKFDVVSCDEENDNYCDIYQYYIISKNGADILQDYTDEIVYYVPLLDCYVWGITHYGTSWDYVLTDIEIKLDNN